MKSNLIIISAFFFCISMESCSFKDSSSNNMKIDCILSAYIKSFEMRLGSDINIFETRGWTDSTTIIHISTLNRKRLKSGDYWFSEFKNAKIYYSQGEFFEKDIIVSLNEEKMIPSNLNWRRITIANKEDSLKFANPEQFDEIQLIYKPSYNLSLIHISEPTRPY